MIKVNFYIQAFIFALAVLLLIGSFVVDQMLSVFLLYLLPVVGVTQLIAAITLLFFGYAKDQRLRIYFLVVIIYFFVFLLPGISTERFLYLNEAARLFYLPGIIACGFWFYSFQLFIHENK